MAGNIVRPTDLPPRTDPVASEVVPSDNGSTVGGVTWEKGVAAGRPLANQAEAEAGIQATKAMTPLTTKQAINALGDARFASAAQGALADSATQPGDLATVATSGVYNDLTGKPALGTAAAAATTDFATAAQGGVADSAVQPGDLATVATTGDYNDLLNKPTASAPGINVQGRLTLTAATAAPENDVVGATSIFYVPSIGTYLPVYDGAAYNPKTIGAGLTLPLNANSGHAGYHAANTNFDLYVIDDGGTLRLVTGPGWTAGAVAGSNVARGTGAGSTELEEFTGYLVNKNSMTARFGTLSGDTVVVPARRATYVGSFRATANGQATDSKASRLLFNAFNRLQRVIKVVDPAVSWTYNTGTYRQANGNANMKAQVLLGLRGIAVEVEYLIVVGNATAGSYAIIAIGLDSTTTASVDCFGGTGFLGTPLRDHATKYKGYPGLGLHELIPLESSGAVGTTTFYSAGNNYNVGLYGSVIG